MKTAKEMRKDLEKRREYERLFQVTEIISNMKQYNGIYSTEPYSYGYNQELKQMLKMNRPSIYLDEFTLRRLKDLGYKVEKKSEEFLIDVKTKTHWFKKDEYIPVYKNIEYYIISAWCDSK